VILNRNDYPFMAEQIPVVPEQREIVEAIENNCQSLTGFPCRRINTHMSHIFISGDCVFKLKRAVLYPFADFSTLVLRRKSCEAELEVNRAFAPTLYKSIIPLVRAHNGEITIGGDGEAVDYVVSMRRFPDHALFSELADAGKLEPTQVEQAVEALIAFHQAQRPEREAGTPGDYFKIVAGLRKTCAEGTAHFAIKNASICLFELLERKIHDFSPLINRRRDEGRVRRGHGDFHLQNICIFEGKVTPFDALEFAPELATIDVIYDVAFLLMDLAAKGLGQIANLAMNHFWNKTAQPESALILLPLFMSLRAAVRMAVLSEAGNSAQADAYKCLGLKLLAENSPFLLAIGGLSGTGKSSVAKAIAWQLPGPCGARWLRTDIIRKLQAGKDERALIPAQCYRPDARSRVYRMLTYRAREGLAAGAIVLADATFQDHTSRSAIESLSDTFQFQGIWLSAPSAIRVSRIAGRRNDPSDATKTIALEQIEPNELGPRWRCFDASEKLETVIEEVTQSIGI
jgi:aminoglycoside phosphotransferase family enzyme/predicted kinase